MATIYWRGRCASLNWVEEGQRRRESLGPVSEAEAQASLTGLERRLSAQVHSAAGPTFDEWSIDYTRWHADEYPDSYTRVEQILRCYLNPYFGPIPIGAITRQQAEAYKHSRLGGASPGTITKEMRTLQAVLNKAVDWEVIPVNRAKGVKPPRDLTSRPPRWYTREELAAIYAADALHAHIWRLLVNTGLRRGEAQQLRRQDVEADAIRVVSSPGARTKSAKWRLVPITAGARIALDGLMLTVAPLARHNGLCDEAMIINEPCGVESRLMGKPLGFRGGPRTGDTQDSTQPGSRPATARLFVIPRMTPYSLTRAFQRTLDRVGLDGHLHCLRHSYCSHLVMAGVPLRTVQVLAGHSTILVTERYAHLAPGHLQDATRGLEL